MRQFSHVRPPTSEGHNFLVRIPILVFFDSMGGSLSQDCSHGPLEDIVQPGMLVLIDELKSHLFLVHFSV